MTKKLIIPVVVVVFAAACGEDGASAEKGAGRNYETVQEGSASGVTSTIAGPGETLAPITGTNADTTSAFTLDPNVGAVPSQSASMAGTLPPPTPAYNPGYSPSPAPATRSASSSSSPAPQRSYVPQPMTSASPAPRPQYQQSQQAQQQPQQQPAEQPREEPADEDVATQEPASGSDTAAPLPAPTQTAPPPQEEPAEDEDEAAEEPPPPPPPAK